MHVTANSKEVKPGSIFFALKGAKFDGHDFITDALTNGAAAVYAERDIGIEGVIILGTDARKKLGELASEMHGHPTHDLLMIGITGTSGKTTTSYLTQFILNENGIPCARIGTNGFDFQNHAFESHNTTPDALTLQKYFREVLDNGAKAVVMEVSSHALDQERVAGIDWDEVCLLNLSPEHMDYHASLDEYFQTKLKLLVDTGTKKKAFANQAHEYGAKALAQLPHVKHLQQFNFSKIKSPLYGSFQEENMNAALTLAIWAGIEENAAISALEKFKGVPGRMEQIHNDKGILVFVDYAHKPEALEKVLQSIQGPRILTVFGCGGDRDRTKRPVMGEIATRLSHFVYITSDNPRTENAESILKEIESGVQTKNYVIISDRAAAIRKALSDAKPGDLVLIAGKGHEDYQIVGNEKSHFDDREQARAFFNFVK